MRIFWSSVRHLERCRAEEDLRAVQVALVAGVSAQSSDSQAFKDFTIQMNEVLETPLHFEDTTISTKDDIMRLISL